MDKHHLAVQILATVNALLSQRGLLLKASTVVDAILIAAPASTKNKDKLRDSKVHSSKKSNKWYVIEGHPTGWGMKAHIGVDAQSGLVCTLRCSMMRKTKLLATRATRQLSSARIPSLRLTGT